VIPTVTEEDEDAYEDDDAEGEDGEDDEDDDEGIGWSPFVVQSNVN
jgi:hypothetical protein